MEKEIKITPPKGFEIDKEHSTFECIKFKPIENKRWIDDRFAKIEGYYINPQSEINTYSGLYTPSNFCVFATQKQAKSALAMARISQIMVNDERFGGVITDEEWRNPRILKYAIITDICTGFHHFLAFHTLEQKDLFLEENEDLVKDYLML